MAEKIKKVYFIGFPYHTYMKAMLANPPEGYEFLYDPHEKKNNLILKMKESKTFLFLYRNVVKKLFNVFSILHKLYGNKAPLNVDLILGGLVFEKKPGVMEVLDTPFTMAGHDHRLFLKNKRKIQKVLESGYCKRIIVHTEDCKKLFAKYFSPRVMEKVIVLSPAIPTKPLIRTYGKKTFTILFMGSINNPEDFLFKGGITSLETFKILAERYKNIEIIIKCKTPDQFKKKYSAPNVKFIESRLSDEEVKQLYQKADILISPGHTYFLMAFLEALSLGLPIIGLDVFGTSDFIDPGENGFRIKPSGSVPYNAPEYPSNIVRQEAFLNASLYPDQRVVRDLADKISVLIEDRKLLKKMSQASFHLSETKFSMPLRLKKLKEIYDKATS